MYRPWYSKFQGFPGMVTQRPVSMRLNCEDRHTATTDSPSGVDRIMSAQRDPYDDPAIRAFGITVQKLRETAGLTKVQLSEAMGYTPQFMGQIEAAKNIPSVTFAQDLDTFFKVDGLFRELWNLIKASHRLGMAPLGFAKYVELERSATTLRIFETRLITDLFQTDDYARAVMGSLMSREAVDEAIKERTERKAIFDRRNPPHVFLIIDERALRREIGSPDVVREQFAHLLEFTTRPEVSFQMLSQDTKYGGAFSGSFTVLGFDGDTDIVYIESAGQGSLIARPPAVASCAMRFDLLRGHAYSITESRSIMERALDTR
jgi:transcriptional regulator with XRE-family HTH domain